MSIASSCVRMSLILPYESPLFRQNVRTDVFEPPPLIRQHARSVVVNAHRDLSRSVHPVRDERAEYDFRFICRCTRLYQDVRHLVPRLALKSIDGRGHNQFGERFASPEGLPGKSRSAKSHRRRIFARPATVESVEVCEPFGITRIGVQGIQVATNSRHAATTCEDA